MEPLSIGLLIGAAAGAFPRFKTMTKTTNTERRPATTWTASPAGVDLVKQFESLRLKTYDANPPKGDWTIGWGHKLRQGESYPNGITRAAADALLLNDLAVAVVRVHQGITYPVNQSEFDALVSLSFNLTSNSWKLAAARLNSGQDAAEVFPLYVYGGGQKLAGLVNRRNTELGVYTA